MTTTSGNLLAGNGPGRVFSGGSHLLTVVYRHFLFVYNLYVGENYLVYHPKLDQRRFCEGSHLLSRD